MGYSDFHTHTTFSDGKNSPSEMIERAIWLGMPSIGISDHSYTRLASGWCIESDERTDEYIAEINRLKELYADRICVFCGIEEDYYACDDLSRFDYSIGSVHHVIRDGRCLDVDKSVETTDGIIDNYYGGDPYAYAEDYYSIVGDVLRKTNADIIGHFDLITKFNERSYRFDEENPRYKNAVTDAIDALLPYGRPFEVNTGAISRGYRTTPYPSVRQLEYINSKGGVVILSSDSHRADTLNFAFEDALRSVRSAGFSAERILTSPRG
jgi:histidinol-phosphatase (PHP family)